MVQLARRCQIAAINDSHEERRQRWNDAGARYKRTSEERAELTAHKAAGGVVADNLEQLEARAYRLIRQGSVPTGVVLGLAADEPLDGPNAMERIIGATQDLQAANFLARGARTATTVARLTVEDNGRDLPLGTGFLVSPRLLMTNNHVLPDVATAGTVVAEFGAEAGIDNQPQAPIRLRLDPDAFFVTDERLDFTIIAVATGTLGRPPGEVFGWNRLIVSQGKIVAGEAMNIIGHPLGRLKEISIRNNLLLVQTDDFLQYETDTFPGNSGSGVFNDQWEVVALHHSGVPATNDQGQVLRKDGTVWRPGDGDDAINWVANEGIRVSVILHHLEGLQLDDAQRTALRELGPESGLAAAPLPAAGARLTARESALGAVAVPGGLKARAGAFGGNVHLVFLHGRSQQGKDPDRLRKSWTAGLNRGLTMAGLPAIEAADVCFPFYGDSLIEALRGPSGVAAEALSTDPLAEVLPAHPATMACFEQIVTAAAEAAGRPTPQDAGRPDAAMEGFGDSLLRRVHGPLSWLAGRSRLDDLFIAEQFKDVAAYLGRDEIRQSVLKCVKDTLPESGTVILISHSLGTVVGMDLLTELAAEPGLSVPLLVTAGSPLGLNAVYEHLISRGPKRPSNLVNWVNTWSPADAVAIGCPLGTRWVKVEDVQVENAADQAHSIAEYLAHPEIAGLIRAQLP